MKSKILLALTLLLGVSTTTWAVGNLGKANQKKHAYTNEDVWAAYEGFNNTLLDSNKYIYKTNSSYPSAVDRGNGAAAIWCQPIYWDMAMNAYKLAKAQKDRKKTSYYKTLCEKIFAGNKAQYCQFDFDDNNENTGWFIYAAASRAQSQKILQWLEKLLTIASSLNTLMLSNNITRYHLV